MLRVFICTYETKLPIGDPFFCVILPRAIQTKEQAEKYFEGKCGKGADRPIVIHVIDLHLGRLEIEERVRTDRPFQFAMTDTITRVYNDALWRALYAPEGQLSRLVESRRETDRSPTSIPG